MGDGPSLPLLFVGDLSLQPPTKELQISQVQHRSGAELTRLPHPLGDYLLQRVNGDVVSLSLSIAGFIGPM